MKLLFVLLRFNFNPSYSLHCINTDISEHIMKELILISIFSCNLAFSQVGKQENNEVDVRYLDLTAVSDREIRITRVNYLGINHMLVIYARNSRWCYRIAAQLSKGLAIYEEDTVSGSAEQILQGFRFFSEIPDQREIKLQYPDGSEMPRDQVVNFFHLVMDGSAYKVELWDHGLHREIRYENPEVYIGVLRKYKFSTIEHERFMEFISYYERIYGPLTGYERLARGLKYGRQN